MPGLTLKLRAGAGALAFGMVCMQAGPMAQAQAPAATAAAKATTADWRNEAINREGIT